LFVCFFAQTNLCREAATTLRGLSSFEKKKEKPLGPGYHIIEMKAIEQYFPVVLCKVATVFESVNEIS